MPRASGLGRRRRGDRSPIARRPRRDGADRVAPTSSRRCRARPTLAAGPTVAATVVRADRIAADLVAAGADRIAADLVAAGADRIAADRMAGGLVSAGGAIGESSVSHRISPPGWSAAIAGGSSATGGASGAAAAAVATVLSGT